jgi:hypothetical protein
MPPMGTSLASRPASPPRLVAETGSQTTEYALILVVAATIASLAWRGRGRAPSPTSSTAFSTMSARSSGSAER